MLKDATYEMAQAGKPSSTDEEDVLAAIDAFDAEYGRNIKLPSEVL